MEATDSPPPYSYLVTWSEKDREFVASFVELPELSGLAPTISEAIREAKTALHVWLRAAQEQHFEIPEPRMDQPCMILDARFMGRERAVVTQDLPEDIMPGHGKGVTLSNSVVECLEA